MKCKQILFSQLLGGCKTDRLHVYAPKELLAAQYLQGHNTINSTLLTELGCVKGDMVPAQGGP